MDPESVHLPLIQITATLCAIDIFGVCLVYTPWHIERHIETKESSPLLPPPSFPSSPTPHPLPSLSHTHTTFIQSPVWSLITSSHTHIISFWSNMHRLTHYRLLFVCLTGVLLLLPLCWGEYCNRQGVCFVGA